MSSSRKQMFVVAKLLGGYTRESQVQIEIIGVYDDEEVAAKVRLASSAQMFEADLNTLSSGLLANAAQLFGSDSTGYQYLASKVTAKDQ